MEFPAALFIALAILTNAQAGLYKSRLTLAIDTLQTNPDSLWAHGEVGDEMMRKGDLEGAASEFLRALALDPGSISAYNNLATVYIREARYAEASALLIKAEQISPESVAIHMNLGQLYLRLGYRSEAVMEFKRAEAILGQSGRGTSSATN